MGLLLGIIGATALGAPASDATLHKQVWEVEGREIPQRAICIARPVLSEGLPEDVASVAVRRGTAGCRLLGVVSGSSWSAPDQTLVGSAPEGGWPPALLAEWTQKVLLAFDQPDGAATSSETDSGVVVTAPFLTRVTIADHRYLTQQVAGRWTFGGDGALTGTAHEPGPITKTSFYTQHYRGSEAVGGPVVGALKQQGRRIRGCFEEAWDLDYRTEGWVRLQWTLQGGRATGLGVVDAPETDHLAKCYANAVREVSFPPSLAGSVIWSFSIRRAPFTAPADPP